MCIYVNQDNVLLISKSPSTLLTALHFIKKAETFESPPPYLIVLFFPHKKAQFCDLTRLVEAFH